LTGPRSGTAFLSASNSVMSVPATVAVSGTSTGFLITTSQSFVSQAVTLSCTLGVTTKTLAFQVAAMPKVVSLQGFPNVIGGASLSIGINLDKVTPYSLPCATSRAPDSPFLTVPSEVVIPSGNNFRTFDATTTQVGATKNFTVSVTAGGATVTKNVTVLINPLDSVTLTPSTVVGGNTSQGTVHFNNLAPPEGVQVTLQKTATDIDIPQTVRVPGGAWKVDFQVLTKPVSSNGTRTIFAKVGTITKSAVLTVIR
jgi:trimeric autotransporter adhesin